MKSEITSIFIVDDDKDIQIISKKLLEFLGFEVMGIAINGEEAVEMFNSFNHKPDIILMDYRMPVKNGLQATREILQIDPDTKIIISSADTTVREESLALGVVDFLEKPFTSQSLLNCINKTQDLH